MLRISAISRCRAKAKASSIFPALDGMRRQRNMGQHQQAFDCVPPIVTPPITTPTDATAVPESPFVPDFDADPPIRPGDDDPPPVAAGRDSDTAPGSPPRGPEAPQPPVSPPGQSEVFPPHGRM